MRPTLASVLGCGACPRSRRDSRFEAKGRSQRLLRCFLLLQPLSQLSDVIRVDRLAETVVYLVLG